jgi:hypothetical protein
MIVLLQSLMKARTQVFFYGADTQDSLDPQQIMMNSSDSEHHHGISLADSGNSLATADPAASCSTTEGCLGESGGNEPRHTSTESSNKGSAADDLEKDWMEWIQSCADIGIDVTDESSTDPREFENFQCRMGASAVNEAESSDAETEDISNPVCRYIQVFLGTYNIPTDLLVGMSLKIPAHSDTIVHCRYQIVTFTM